MLNTPFSPWPSFSAEEAEAVSKVLLSNKVNYWTGEVGREFERDFSKWCGSVHSVALANGTVAIDAALIALGVTRGDEVIVTPRTFLASASAIVSIGAVPVFADVERETQNISARTIAPLITSKTRAIIAVHLAGLPCEMDEIMGLAEENHLFVIEDCAQAHGAKYRGRSVGSIGHAGAWSFCQDKIMTTGGEGGMLTTSDDQTWSRVWSLKDHGKSWDAVYKTEHPSGFRWLHESFGTNWRMTEMQSMIGRIQLSRMDEWHKMRSKNAQMLSEAFSVCEQLRLPIAPDYVEHAWYKFYAFVQPDRLKPDWNRDRMILEISNREVPVYSGSCSEIYLEKCFDATSFRPQNRLPIARELGETSLMFLVHPTLTASEIEKTQEVVSDVCKMAAR